MIALQIEQPFYASFFTSSIESLGFWLALFPWTQLKKDFACSAIWIAGSIFTGRFWPNVDVNFLVNFLVKVGAFPNIWDC